MPAEQQNNIPIDPESLVARIVEELRANPAAQRLLLRTLLTNEFLGRPARLQNIERDVAELKVTTRPVAATEPAVIPDR